MLSPTYLECMKINAEIHQPLADLLSDTSSILITDFCFKCTLNKQTYFKSYLPLAVTCLVASCIPLLGKNVIHRQQRMKTVEAKLLQFTNSEKHFRFSAQIQLDLDGYTHDTPTQGQN